MKKSLVVLAMLAASGAAVAGHSVANQNNTFTQSIYVQGSVGYDMTNFAKLYPAHINTKDYSHANGGYTAAAAIGYNLFPNFGLEAGAVFPLQNMEHTGHNHKISSHYSFYGAGKFNVPLGVSVDAFALGGLAYTHITDANAMLNGHTAYTSSKSNSGIGFMGGVGLDYHLGKNFLLGAEYLYLAGNDKDENGAKPNVTASQLFVASAGFNFPM